MADDATEIAAMISPRKLAVTSLTVLHPIETVRTLLKSEAHEGV